MLADQLKADALLVFTLRGTMARAAAAARPRYSPIYAICERPEVAAGLTLHWGLESLVHVFNHERPEQTVETALRALVEKGRLKPGQTAVVISSISAGDPNQIVDVVEMRVVT